MGMHIAIVGNVVDGLKFYGPFKTAVDAMNWCNENITVEEWCIAPLQANG
jgi:hypothetical protein